MTAQVLLSEWDVPDLFNKHRMSVEKLLKAVVDLDVVDEMSCKLALNISSDAKVIMSDITTAKKKAVEPSKQFINMINESAKAFTEKLDTVQAYITQKMAIYEVQLKLQSETAQKEAENLSETLGLDVSLIMPNEQRIGSTAKTIVSHKTERDFAVVNESLIPREYLMIDESKVKLAMKMGITHIPGLQITESKKIVLRRR